MTVNRTELPVHTGHLLGRGRGEVGVGDIFALGEAGEGGCFQCGGGVELRGDMYLFLNLKTFFVLYHPEQDH